MSENIDVQTRLKERRPDRPWQLLMIGKGISQITPQDVDALTRIFDLFPHVGGLDVTTSAGPVWVSRDFSSDYTHQVDQLLAEIFQRNSAVTGIAFPAASGQPRHIATPDNPHWLAQGQALEALSKACQRGEITADEMANRVKDLTRQSAHDATHG
ncbi:hypothetical protein BVER_02742c [Candidatus Burkholderia verschuerenii]|uniref:Uncharacterized protein n=1 Tax=Candidatus Burkholderia verschuerenii TaxID=242163 RepID=A0A0L0M4Y8_9BURK|nr:hypothetical protein [Candidatus Burkholderia verschuerenii]KND57345.1 hypothetical protein BVER_02742c [Candidatus Burkholderia verschuerenii]